MPTIEAKRTHPLAHLNTVQTLEASRAVLLGLDALLLLAVLLGAHVHRDAMQVVGKDSAPSIIAAQHIKAAMSDMDADAANELLGQAGSASVAATAYDVRRVEAAKALIAAAENITFGESERVPIQTLQVGLGTYERMVQRSLDRQGSSQAEAVHGYRDAADLMDFTLQPAADALDQANNAVLLNTYLRQSTDSAVARAFVVVAGVLLLLALVMTQILLSRRMRRTLNPLLAGATLLALLLTGLSLHTMELEQHELREAKEDAFASIYALWQARAAAYRSEGEESRYLLYRATEAGLAGTAETLFQRSTSAVAKLPPGEAPEPVLHELGDGKRVDGFTGLLADELNNITYPGEREAGVRALDRWERFLAVDARIRELEDAGKHQDAVALDLGNSASEANWSFQQFDEALGNGLEINQHAFDVAVSSGLGATEGLDLKAALAAALLAVLVWLGLAPRIREYE